MTRKSILAYLAGISVLLAVTLAWYVAAYMNRTTSDSEAFSGQRALQDVETQVAFGPRTPGSEAHARTLAWMQSELQSAGWTTRLMEAQNLGHPIQNLVAYRDEVQPHIILGAHYDSRLHADEDPNPTRRSDPVPGANDGASGVAVLLELARSLPDETEPVWLVFFDAEDNGRIPGWDWILGSQVFASQLDFSPEGVVVVDMVGDAEQEIYIEGNSDPALVSEIWNTAGELGNDDRFLPETRHSMLDDHTPFLQKGIPAMVIIDFEYPYWHTTADTTDKVSAESLQAVGETLHAWLIKRGQD